MNLLHCCLAAMLVASAVGAAVDVEKTVKQVQNILQGNSLLPRLTRDEILELLNDIRAEDAKSTSASTEDKTTSTTSVPYSAEDNEIAPATQQPNIDENIVFNGNENTSKVSLPQKSESTTKPGPSVMVVLPYTPRDGSSLQELYTRPPRVERIPLADVTPKPVKTLSPNKLQETLTQNAKLAEKKKQEFPAELQAFLDAHGLTGKPGQDHFLLPLDGFKPLPPPRVIDGTVQLPENILLTYDLISPSDDKIAGNSKEAALSPSNFLYEPLRPELPFELDTSSSETKEQIYPFDMPKTRKAKSASPIEPNYAPIDYESVKVIPLPLNKGVSPVEDININTSNEQSKRQTNSSSEETTTTATVSPETTTGTEEPKSAPAEAPADSESADSDTGASLSDLADSFGGPLPEEPSDSVLPPPRKNGFYWMLDWNSFLEVGDGDSKVNIRFEPKFGDPQMFLPVSVP